jgi:hypothetical protein
VGTPFFDYGYSQSNRSSAMTFADVVFVGGRILSMNDASEIFGELAVTDGAISRVGGTGSVAELIGPNTQVVDLDGGTVLPGLNDSHLHALSFGLGQPPLTLDVGYPTVTSIAEVKAIIAERVKTLAPGEWVIGTGWDPGFLAECAGADGRARTQCHTCLIGEYHDKSKNPHSSFFRRTPTAQVWNWLRRPV